MQRGRVFALILLVLLMTGCAARAKAPAAPTESKFVISVSGSDGVAFTGSYMVVMADGSSTSHSIEGTVPAEYTATGWIVSCVFQNKGDGLFGVAIHKDGNLIGPSTTTAQYGVVTLAAP